MTFGKLLHLFPVYGAVGISYCALKSLILTSCCEIECRKAEIPKSEILFLGTGSSLGTPVAIHLMNPDIRDPSTLISREAAEGDPRENRNYRCNPSIMVRHRTPSVDGSAVVEKNIVVDVGKTFRESSVRWFPKHGVHTVDAILLTHGHADAIFGLDDVRCLQNPLMRAPMNVYLSPDCLNVVKQVFFYLFPRQLDPVNVPRLVSTIQWHEIQPQQPFIVSGTSLNVMPFAVKHGEDMESMGFIFGSQNIPKVCYISDISRMPCDSLEYIQKQGPLELLIVDALKIGHKHPTHYTLEQAIDLCKLLQPKRALLIGMGPQIEHHSTNEMLKRLLAEDGLDVQLAYDGMTYEVAL